MTGFSRSFYREQGKDILIYTNAPRYADLYGTLFLESLRYVGILHGLPLREILLFPGLEHDMIVRYEKAGYVAMTRAQLLKSMNVGDDQLQLSSNFLSSIPVPGRSADALQCPICQACQHVAITVEPIEVPFDRWGHDLSMFDMSMPSPFAWGSLSRCRCLECNHIGQVIHFCGE